MKPMTDAEFAQSLKVGDRWQSVFFGTWGLVAREHIVERVTDASIWISGQRYCRRTGSMHGDRRESIPRPAKPEELQMAREDAERNAIVRVLRNHDWRRESLETLRAVASAIAKREPQP